MRGRFRRRQRLRRLIRARLTGTIATTNTISTGLIRWNGTAWYAAGICTMTGVGATFAGGFGVGVGLAFVEVGVAVGVGMITGAATAGDGTGAAFSTTALGTDAGVVGGGGNVQMSTAVGSGSVGCGPVGPIDGGGSPVPPEEVSVGDAMGVAGAVWHDSPTVTPIPTIPVSTPTSTPPGQADTETTELEEDPDEATADSARLIGSAAAAAQTPTTVITFRPIAPRPERRARPADAPRRRMYLLLPVRTLLALDSSRRSGKPSDQFEPGAARNWLSGVESAWITP